MVLTSERVRSHHGLSSTIAWSRGAEVQHALEGNISVSGHAVAFATRLLNVRNEDALTELALGVASSDGVTFVPALAGLGAPHWKDNARGLISGMSLRTTPAHIALATFEGIALQIFDVFTAMEADLGGGLPSLSVDGGASKNDLLMQLVADLVARPVVRPVMTDASALGAASLARLAVGLGAPAHSRAAPDRFEPAMGANARNSLVSQWREAILRSKLDGEPLVLG